MLQKNNATLCVFGYSFSNEGWWCAKASTIFPFHWTWTIKTFPRNLCIRNCKQSHLSCAYSLATPISINQPTCKQSYWNPDMGPTSMTSRSAVASAQVRLGRLSHCHFHSCQLTWPHPHFDAQGTLLFGTRRRHLSWRRLAWCVGEGCFFSVPRNWLSTKQNQSKPCLPEAPVSTRCKPMKNLISPFSHHSETSFIEPAAG